MFVKNDNGSQVTFETKCVICNKKHTFVEDKSKVHRWVYGAHIQDVWPEKSDNEREKMISGTCPECFDELFPPDED
ncbi:MAG TPA: hypothetical protein VLN58_02075 [Verrucomicrobiae bacterium]|nr:hypothetical protein [Verrucomicrobiae bacterium]